VAVAVGLGIGVLRNSAWKPHAAPAVTVFDAKTPLKVIAPALRENDTRALTALAQKLATNPDAPPKAIRDEDAQEWIDTLIALRASYLKFSGQGRIVVLQTATKIFDRFAIDGGPSNWMDMLPPLRDVMNTGMIDRDVAVRVAALAEMGRLWSWTPGITPTPVQETELGEWKAGLYRTVLRCLAYDDPKARVGAIQVRVAAVSCLGYLPLDHVASPAVSYINDMTPGAGPVRRQVLISFARRRSLLTEDAVLKCLYDQEPGIPEMAELILKARGLNQEQISLGKMIFHPKPELRASVIPLLRSRRDIDPVVWLLQLTRDSEEMVRVGAVEALSSRLSPEVRRRLAEMAASDDSPKVRDMAAKIVPPGREKTASLPPLPGSVSLNPKAN
jgi:hypothetical protein